jgi:TadE-like protein
MTTRSLRALFRRLDRDQRGSILIETAITLPVLGFLAFAGLEIANLMLTHTRISNIALSAADNASRMAPATGVLALPDVRESDINDVFTGAQLQSGSIDIQSNGRIIMSSLEVNPEGGQWIHWQRCFGSRPYASSFGVAGTGATGNTFEGMGINGRQIRAEAGIPVMFVEVFYDYEPFIYESWIGERTINYTAAFAARDSRNTASGVTNPAPAAPVRNCS